MQLWLVRHARPLVPAGVCYGALDIPADADHTQQVALRLANALPRDIAVRCSPRLRCQQLADALIQQRPDLAPVTDARLAEMDFGRWEGRHWDEIGAAALDAWTMDFATHQPGGGESVQMFMARVDAAWCEGLNRGLPEVWLTHAGVIRAATLLARGLRELSRADQWPTNSLGYGEWFSLSRER